MVLSKTIFYLLGMVVCVRVFVASSRGFQELRITSCFPVLHSQALTATPVPTTSDRHARTAGALLVVLVLPMSIAAAAATTTTVIAVITTTTTPPAAAIPSPFSYSYYYYFCFYYL